MTPEFSTSRHPERGQPCPRELVARNSRIWLFALRACARSWRRYAKKTGWLLLGFGLAALLPMTAPAHEDLLLRISLLTERLHTNGPSAEVTFQRAEIYRLHQDWELSLRDYDSAAPGLTNEAEVDLGRALALVGWGKLLEARSVFDRVLQFNPTNALARLERARVLTQLNEPVLAVADYSQAILHQPNPRAGDYLERAQLQVAVFGPAVALKGLDEGLTRLGWTLTLQVLAVDCEVAGKNFDAALARLETILARSARQESWLARKGQILLKAGRLGEAKRAFETAMAIIKGLPPRLASSERVAALRTEIDASLAALRAAEETHPTSPQP